MKARYLVRPDDSCIFEYVEEHGGVYRPMGSEFPSYAHFTYENLVEVYDFFPIAVGQVSFWQKKSKEHYKSLQEDSNGHG